MTRKKNHVRGFTLIELMIVVAIIGILASIAMPNFQRFKCKSQQSEVFANLGTLRTALESYVVEKGLPSSPFPSTGFDEFRSCQGVNKQTTMGLSIQGKAGRYSYDYQYQAATGSTYRWKGRAVGCLAGDFAGEIWEIDGTAMSVVEAGLNRCRI